MLNMEFMQSQQGNEEFLRLMQAQHRMTRDMIHDWLQRKPWEYGSVDSCDYMKAAFQLSADMVDALLTDGGATFMEELSFEYLFENYACDGVCNELQEKYPDPEDDQ